MFSYNEHYSGIVYVFQQKKVIRNPVIFCLFLCILYNNIEKLGYKILLQLKKREKPQQGMY